ncbi:transposase [Streptomyces sp. NPDC003283]
MALDMLDELARWGMRPPVVVTDAAYGTNAPPAGWPGREGN